MGDQYSSDIKSKNIFLILFSQAIGAVCTFIILVVGIFSDLSAVAVVIALIISIASIVYPLVMMTKVSGEINVMCEDDGEHLMPYVCAWLLGLVTLGIYYLYYLYRMQTRLKENAYRYDVVITESGGAIILWFLLLAFFFGIGPIVSLAIIIKNFNKMVYGYNLNNINPVPAPDSYPDTISRQGVLRCIRGELGGASVIIDDGETIHIGRDPGKANFIINDEKISRLHCSIKYDANNNIFIITDFSKNGTVLGNGKRLSTGESTNVFCNTEFTLANRVTFLVDIKKNIYEMQ